MVANIYTDILDELIEILTDLAFNRPSEKSGRTHVEIIGTIASGLIYTVPVGSVFYATSISCTARTTVATASFYSLRDGGAGGTIKSLSTNLLSLSGNCLMTPSISGEPILFSTDLFLNIDSGTFTNIRYMIVGYDEII